MKILQLSYRLPYPLKDGGAIGIFNLTKAYYQLGHQVTLLTFNTHKHFVEPNKIGSELTSICNLIPIYHNTNLSPIKAFISLLKNESYNINRFISDEFTTKLIELLKNNKYDLIHVDGLFMAPYMDIIKQYSASKIIVRAHNVEHFIWEKLALNSSFPKNIYLKILASQMKREEILFWKKADDVAAINNSELDFIANIIGKSKVKLLAAGIFIEPKIENKIERKPLSIAYIGSLEWMPNTEAVNWFLKNVWPIIIAKIPNAKFYLAGRNTPQYYFDLKINGLIVVGEIENAQQFLADKQLMIVPLLSGGGVRIKIIEAMANATAIIATDIAAEGLQCTHHQNIIIANDAETMADEIVNALQNEALLDKLRTNAEAHAQQFFNQKKLLENFLLDI
jgi:polysaccharide biosynthesis protein PslH